MKTKNDKAVCRSRSIKRKVYPLLRILPIAILTLLFSFNLAVAASSYDLSHPIMKPKMYSANMTCPNCGMMINMWARTRHSFQDSSGDHETCSIRCLADMASKAGENPQSVKVALYLEPEKMVAADKAVYVVDSTARGTRTMKSKIAFASEKNALDFVSKYGGEVKSFTPTMEMAKIEAIRTREKIQSNRMKKGKITSAPAGSSCTVCGMPPANYPKHRSQVTTADGDHLHFCSTQCMVNFLADPDQDLKDKQKANAAWVTVYQEGDYEYANGLYYLVGSKIMGPMGLEALPYRSKKEAMAAAAASGGKVVLWQELTPALVMGK